MDEQFRSVAEIYDRMEKEIYALRQENDTLKSKISLMAEELMKRSSEVLRAPIPTMPNPMVGAYISDQPKRNW